MAELIKRDGVSVIITENEIGLGDLEKSIKITQANIDSIDYNMKGMQQRREKLIIKLNQLNAIKDSLPVEATTLEPLA